MSLEKTIAVMFENSEQNKVAFDARQKNDGTNDVLPRPNNDKAPNTATERNRNRIAQIKTKIIDDQYHPEEPLVDEEIVTTGQRGTNTPSGPMFRGRSPVKNATFNYGGDGNISSYVERLNKKTGDITATSQTALTQGSKNNKQTYTDSITSVTNPAKPGVNNTKSNRTLITKQVRAEAKEHNMTLDEKKKMSKADIAALEDPKGTIDAKDFAALRAGKHKTMKEEKATYCGACGKIHRKGKCNMKEEIELDEVSNKKLDAYRQKAFADQPSGNDGSDKYRKRKFGRDLAFAKQTGRAKVRATKEEFEQVDEVLDTLPKMTRYVAAHNASHDKAIKTGDKETARKRQRGSKLFTTAFNKANKIQKEEFEHIDEMFSEIALFASERFGSNDIGEKVAIAIVNKLYEELEPLFEASGEYVTMKKVNRKKTVRNNPALIGKYKSMGWVMAENQITFDERLDQIFEAIEVTKRARGRPRKNPPVDPNAPKRPRGRPTKVADASTTAGKEDLKNPNTLHLNLKRAADQGELGNVMHTFANGDTATINPGHAKQFMARHSQIKSSNDKDTLLRHAHSSPQAFMSMVKGETAPTETKKGIALGGSARLKALLGKED